MLFLKTLGGLSVEADGAPATGAAQQRKMLALLALLAASRRGISRDKLIAYLWPESDTEHARNTLKQACHALRRDLHSDLFLGAAELRLNPDVITTDIGTVEDALDGGDLPKAVAACTGPFLDGFYLAGVGEFERWVEETRASLKRRVGGALESLARQAASAGDVQSAVQWWRRFAAVDPLGARPALGLLHALTAAGERTAALEFGRVHETLVREELGTAPDAGVGELLERLRAKGKEPVAPEASAEDVPPPMVAVPGAATVRAPLRTVRVGWRLALGAVLLGIVAVAIVAGDREPVFDPELLAVAPFDVLDQRFDLWQEGLVDVLSRDLDGAGPYRTVSPTVAIRRWGGGGRADRASARALGAVTGARIVVFGQLLAAGPDSVRLRVAVLDARRDRLVGEVERTEQAGRIDRLADSVALDVIRALTPGTAPIQLRGLSVGTKSLPALKAFLQGERYFRRFALDSAVASYDRAIALDSTFALALRGAGLARGWNSQMGGNSYLVRAGALNHGLSPRDSLLLASDSQIPASYDPAFRTRMLRKFAILEEAAQRYVEDPEVWYQLGEARHHEGFVVRSTWDDARAAFDRAIALDSGFAPAYIHPVEISLSDNDPDAALRYVRGYLAIPSVIPEGAGMRLLNLILDPQAGGPQDLDHELETAAQPALFYLALAIRSWPDSEETSIAVLRRLLASASPSLVGYPGDAEDRLGPYRSLFATALVFRGHLREARGVVENRSILPAFMELARLGAIPRDSVERALVRWFDAPDNRFAHVYFPWLMEGFCYQALDVALWWAEQRDTVRLLRLMRREASAAQTVNPLGPPNDRPMPEFGRAALALARGDTATALNRFLAFPEASCPGARQRGEVLFRLLAATRQHEDAVWVFDRLHDRRVPLLLERARLAERMGDRPTAIHYYQFVLQAWLHADPELQPFVAEARVALARLGEKRGP